MEQLLQALDTEEKKPVKIIMVQMKLIIIEVKSDGILLGEKGSVQTYPNNTF